MFLVKTLFTKEAGGERVLFCVFLYTNQVLRQHQKERGCFLKGLKGLPSGYLT